MHNQAPAAKISSSIHSVTTEIDIEMKFINRTLDLVGTGSTWKLI